MEPTRHLVADDLLNFLTEPANDTEARAHLVSCPICQERLRAIRPAALASTRDELTCVECERLLAEGQTAETSDKVRRHLSACAACRRAAEGWATTWEKLVKGTLPPLVGSPRPRSVPAPSTRDPLTTIRRSGLGWVQTQAAQLRIELSSLFAAPPPLAAAVRSAPVEELPTLGQLSIAQADDLDVELQATPDPAHPGQALLSVQVFIPSRGLLGFGGSHVRLLSPAGVQAEALTDESGQAELTGVPLAGAEAWWIEIEPGAEA